MAMNTYQTYLGYGASSASYTKVIIKDYPDFLNEVNTIDVTSLDDAAHTYIMGLQDTGGDISFTANYDKTVYAALNGLSSEQFLVLAFGSTGTDGNWKFKGYVNAGIVGKGADEAREMTIHVTASTVPVFGTASVTWST